MSLLRRAFTLVLISAFVVAAFLYAQTVGTNDIGFLLTVALGVAGIVLILVKYSAELAISGEGLLGLALFILIVNLFGVPLT